MLIEIGTTILAGGVAAFAQTKSNGGISVSDVEKIQRIFTNCGLTIREGKATKTIRLHRRRRLTDGTEYVYQLPLGMSYEKVRDCLPVIEDGLNTKNTFALVDFEAFRGLRLDRTIWTQIQALIRRERHRKEVTADFDGMLRLRVYNRPLPANLPWTDDYLPRKSWRIPVGQAREGFRMHDFDERPHMAVAGATGFGKSQFLKAAITSLVAQHGEDLALYLIDLKGGLSFSRFRNLRQTKGFARTPDEAAEVLRQVQSAMTAQIDSLEAGDHENVKEAGYSRRHFVIIDEAADIAGDRKCMEMITDIARRGNAPGYRLIYATQYPTNETLPSQVRQNIGARVCFVLETGAASRAVLDEQGAEKLPEIPGRAIYKRVRQETVQCPYMQKKDIAEKIEPHVTIRGRNEKEEERKHGGRSDQRNTAAGTRGTYSIEFEETRLS